MPSTKSKVTLPPEQETIVIPEPAQVYDLPTPVQDVERTEITVTFKTTIPTQQYGNLEFFLSQKVMARNTEESRLMAMVDAMNEMKYAVVQVVLPLVEAEVERAKPALLKEANPDNWMQLKNPAYRWLRVASPYTPIDAMENLLNARIAGQVQ